jgi:hypothetical protein
MAARLPFDGSPGEEYGGDLWHVRRIFWHYQCFSGVYPGDITLVNWPQIDYGVDPMTNVGKPPVGRGVTSADRANALAAAKELSLSLLYWMQTEAPRKEGGYGYPGLRLRPDLVGTADGLAKAPYIRGSRWIRPSSPSRARHDARSGPRQPRAPRRLPGGPRQYPRRRPPVARRPAAGKPRRPAVRRRRVIPAPRC